MRLISYNDLFFAIYGTDMQAFPNLKVFVEAGKNLHAVTCPCDVDRFRARVVEVFQQLPAVLTPDEQLFLKALFNTDQINFA